jgi:hypothetical protein
LAITHFATSEHLINRSILAYMVTPPRGVYRGKSFPHLLAVRIGDFSSAKEIG